MPPKKNLPTEEEIKIRNDSLMSIQGFIILIQKPYHLLENVFFGPVEQSFSLSVEEGRTQFFWEHNSDPSYGLIWAEKSLKSFETAHPNWSYQIYDVKRPSANKNVLGAEELPVIIDWDDWLDANQLSNTLSGVKDKYRARNLKITSKNLEPPENVTMRKIKYGGAKLE